MKNITLFEHFYLFEAMSPDDIYSKYYSDIVDESEFKEIISFDPTTKIKNGKIKKVGRYSKWILNLYKNKKLLVEDLYKIKETLEYFHDFNKRGILRKNSISTDINKYNTLPSLWSAIKNLIDSNDENTLSNREIEQNIKNEESEKFWENDKCYVIKLLSHNAACYYGKGTRWCTASKDNATYFNDYYKNGPLYVIIDKNDSNVKYQFHIESKQFTDVDDTLLDPDLIYEILTQYNLGTDFIEKVFVKDNKLIQNIEEPDLIEFEKIENEWYVHFDYWSDFLPLLKISLEEENFLEKVFVGTAFDQSFPYISYDSLPKDIIICKEVMNIIYEILKMYYPNIIEENKGIINDILKNKSFYIFDLNRLFEFFPETDIIENIKTEISISLHHAQEEELYNEYKEDVLDTIKDWFGMNNNKLIKNDLNKNDKEYRIKINSYHHIIREMFVINFNPYDDHEYSYGRMPYIEYDIPDYDNMITQPDYYLVCKKIEDNLKNNI